MRLFIAGVLLVLWGENGLLAQKSENIYLFRDHKSSLLLADKKGEVNTYAFSDYGNKLFAKDRNHWIDRYLFAGQEYEKELEIYLYPSRFYAPNSARFITPDPLSQYHSPYLYVGADPVNYVDYDGNEGRPLILYQADYNLPGEMPSEVFALQNQLPDAYYVPLNDFVNDAIPDLNEWDGNVFIYGDVGMEARAGGVMSLESSTDERNLRVKPGKGIARRTVAGKTRTDMKATKFGSRLREFSDDLGIDLNSVVVGGSNGDRAAIDIGRGFSKRAKGSAPEGKSFKTAGLKKGTSAHYFNDEDGIYLGKYRNGMKEPRIYFAEEDVKSFETDYIPPGGGGDYMDAVGPEDYMYDLKGVDANGETRYLDYADSDGIRSLAGGRVPETLEDKFYQFKFEY